MHLRGRSDEGGNHATSVQFDAILSLSRRCCLPREGARLIASCVARRRITNGICAANAAVCSSFVSCFSTCRSRYSDQRKHCSGFAKLTIYPKSVIGLTSVDLWIFPQTFSHGLRFSLYEEGPPVKREIDEASSGPRSLEMISRTTCVALWFSTPWIKCAVSWGPGC